MKNYVLVLAVLVFAVSVSFAGFDQTISTTYEYGVVVEYDRSLLVTGAGADLITAWDFSYIEIQNTAPYQLNVGGVLGLKLFDSSSLHFYDGEIIGLDIKRDATAVLEGGQINSIESWQDVYVGVDVIKHIEIICNDYNYTYNFDTSDRGENIDLLSIQWEIGDEWIDIKLIDQDGYDPVIDNIFFTPEPASLALLGLGGLLLRRKKS